MREGYMTGPSRGSTSGKVVGGESSILLGCRHRNSSQGSMGASLLKDSREIRGSGRTTRQETGATSPTASKLGGRDPILGLQHRSGTTTKQEIGATSPTTSDSRGRDLILGLYHRIHVIMIDFMYDFQRHLSIFYTHD